MAQRSQHCAQLGRRRRQRWPQQQQQQQQQQGEWKELSGDFKAINVALLVGTGPKALEGMAPSACLSDGLFHLIVVHKCRRDQYLRFLLKLAGKDNQFDLPYVEHILCRAVQVQPTPGTVESSWNCDGELLTDAALTATVHRSKVPVFARGVERGGIAAPRPTVAVAEGAEGAEGAAVASAAPAKITITKTAFV